MRRQLASDAIDLNASSTGLKELAFQVTTDADHKFELALQLDDLDAALEIVRALPETEAETKWKAVGDRALAVWRFDLARECFEKASDLNALMLLLLAIGDRDGLTKLASQAGALAFTSLVITHLANWHLGSQRRRAKITWRSLAGYNSATRKLALTYS